VQLGAQFGARVSRVLHPIKGRGRFNNLSVQPGDVLVSIQGRDISGGATSAAWCALRRRLTHSDIWQASPRTSCGITSWGRLAAAWR